MTPEHTLPESTSDLTGWATGRLLGFDTETTGVDPRSDRLVTAALVSRGPLAPDGTRQEDVTTWLADPGVEIPAAATAVHGVTTQQARTEGRAAAEVLEEVASLLAEAMADGVPVVAFNAAYDLTLMEHELARHHLATLTERLGREVGPVLDPLVLDRAVDRYRRGKRRLGDLCSVYGIRVDESLHTAQVDVAATLDVLEAIVLTHPEVGRVPAAELVTWQASAHRTWAKSFNAWLAARDPHRTPAGLDWPVDRG